MMLRLTMAAVLALGALTGCPPDVEEPEPPDGRPCTQTADCVVEGAMCGLVFACVAGVCEADPSRTVPCDGGT